MKNLWMGIFAGVLLCGLSLAQDAATPPSNESAQTSSTQQASPQPASTSAPDSNHAHIAPGSVIPVQLTKGVDAKKTKSGDEVDARVTQDLKSSNGQLVLAKDTKVVGHVTEAQAHTKDQRESEIGIVFDHAVMKDGNTVTLPMSIQAIIAPQALSGGQSNEGAGQQPPASDSSGMPTSGGRAGGMGTATNQPHMPSASAANDSSSSSASSASPTAITANTQGVVGISDMKLSTAGEAEQGSVVRSEKNNVKLDNGTLMLLRVNQ